MSVNLKKGYIDYSISQLIFYSFLTKYLKPREILSNRDLHEKPKYIKKTTLALPCDPIQIASHI